VAPLPASTLAAVHDGVLPPWARPQRTADPATGGDGSEEVVVGYMQYHPWPAAMEGEPPHLADGDAARHIAAAAAAGAGQLLFIHEISVALQGRGVGSVFMNAAVAAARDGGYRRALLVAGLGNGARWAQFGFRRRAGGGGGYAGGPSGRRPPPGGA